VTHRFFQVAHEIVGVTRYDVPPSCDRSGYQSTYQTDAPLSIDFQRIRIKVCKRSTLSLALANHNRQSAPRKGRRGLWSPGPLLILLLTCSVFAWGTSYKLSLYKNNPPGLVTPAKLCKLTSDNAKSQLDHAVDGHRALLAVFLITLLPISRELVLVIQGQIMLNGVTCNLAPLKAAPVLHLRPPPTRTYRLFR
jgi:hypothetical protein